MFPRSLLTRFMPWTAALLAAGCVRTEITGGLEGVVEGLPYRHLLVCSMNPDPAAERKIEETMAARLARHGVRTQLCADYLRDRQRLPAQQAADDVRAAGLQGILVTQRVMTETPSHKVQDLLEAPKVRPVRGHRNDSPVEDKALMEPFGNIIDFITHYDAIHERPFVPAPEPTDTQVNVFGKERSIHARGDLLGIREDRTVWSTGGLIQGGAEEPSEKFVRSFAKTIERGLLDAGILPKK